MGNPTMADLLTALNVLQEEYDKIRAAYEEDVKQSTLMARTLVTIMRRFGGSLVLRKDKVNEVGSKYVVNITEEDNMFIFKLIPTEEFLTGLAKQQEAAEKKKQDEEAAKAKEDSETEPA